MIVAILKDQDLLNATKDGFETLCLMGDRLGNAS